VVTLDLILVIIILLGALNGYRTGFIRQVLRLFGGVIAYFVSWWLRPYLIPLVSPFVQKWGILPKNGTVLAQTTYGGLSGAIAFGLVFIVSFLMFRYAAALIDAVFRLPILSFINRVCGLAAGILLSLIFVDVALYVLSEIHTNTLTYQMQHSMLAGWLMNEGKIALHTLLKLRSAS
jgi:uncharacterized membrane protein required for colicin V production